jgi:hypothetical protein
MAHANSPASRSGAEANRETPPARAGGAAEVDPLAIIRSRQYVGALVLAAIVGIPVSVVAYGFLALVATIQKFLFSALPNQIFGMHAPA